MADVVSNVLGSAVPHDQPLMEAGLDSLGAVELRNSISSSFGVDLPATASFDFPTISALATHLAGVVAPASLSFTQPLTGVQDPVGRTVHIAGLSCTFPGGHSLSPILGVPSWIGSPNPTLDFTRKHRGHSPSVFPMTSVSILHTPTPASVSECALLP